MATDPDREALLAELDATDFALDAPLRHRAEAAFAVIDWSIDLAAAAATCAGRQALLRGAAHGFERHGPAVVAAIVRDQTGPVPCRGISEHATVGDDVDAARRFLVEQFGRVRGRPMEHMFAAVDDAVVSGRRLIVSERNFLDHELLEASHVAAGLSQREAHLKVHETIPPGANFSPHVLVELHDHFGPENFVYWGLTK